MLEVSEVLVPSEADSKCATENPLCEDLFEEEQKPKGITKFSLRPSPPVLWRICLPARGEMESRKQCLSPTLLVP